MHAPEELLAEGAPDERLTALLDTRPLELTRNKIDGGPTVAEVTPRPMLLSVSSARLRSLTSRIRATKVFRLPCMSWLKEISIGKG